VDILYESAGLSTKVVTSGDVKLRPMGKGRSNKPHGRRR